MKIEIDLQDILGDEYGSMESLSESIHRQVVDYVSSQLSKGIQAKMDAEVSKVLSGKVTETAEKVIPKLLEDLIDHEYAPVNKYGEKDDPTTLRKQFISTLAEQMTYKQTQYSSDRNYFTKSVDTLVGSELKKFEEQFKSKVNEIFTKEAFDYAATKMRQKLGM